MARRAEWALWAAVLVLICVADANAADCPAGWLAFSDYCYKFVVRSINVRGKNWENARAECVGYAGDLVSITNASEHAFVTSQTSKHSNEHYWIGFNDKANESVFVWSDQSPATFLKWARSEPNDYGGAEDCTELFRQWWNDNDCNKEFSYVCKRKKGIPMPTFSTLVPPTTATYLYCPPGWEHFGKSCYKFSQIRKKWSDARLDCHQSGGYLLKIDDGDEQHYITSKAQQLSGSMWIGLNDIGAENVFVWEGDRTVAKYTNWQSGEPNDHASVEDCVQVYTGWGAGYWNDDYCDMEIKYICELPNGQNLCPPNWLTFGDYCYQLNLHALQYKSWQKARDACSATSGASLASVSSSAEQHFLLKQMKDWQLTSAWIGLSDLEKEGFFVWTDRSKLTYKNWAANEPSTGYSSRDEDCVVIQGNAVNGTWAAARCSPAKGFICKKKRGFETCESPLGMESGVIADSQITASSIGNANSPASQARLRLKEVSPLFGAWCPASNKQGEYLQVDFGVVRRITHVALQGRPGSVEYVKTFYVTYGNDGQDFTSYGQNISVSYKVLSGSSDATSVANVKLSEPISGRFVRIYPLTWNQNICLRTEFYGCAYQGSSQDCGGFGWEKGPDSTCYQFNTDQTKLWADARATCLTRGGDLLSVTSVKESTFLTGRLTSMAGATHSFWIGLNDRDSAGRYYWSDDSAVPYTAWDAGNPTDTQNKKSCVEIVSSNGKWRDVSCGSFRPFICKKVLGSRYGDKLPITSYWISATDKYWPLDEVVNKKLLGTIPAGTNGQITSVNVSQASRPALRFRASQTYAQVSGQSDCTGNPDVCANGLTVAIITRFDASASSWTGNTFIVDSIGDEKLRSSRGFSVYVSGNKLQVVVFTERKMWSVSDSLRTDLWQHVLFTWQANQGLVLYINGKKKISTSFGTTHSSRHDQFNGVLTIGNQQSQTSGSFNARALAVWHRVLGATEVEQIYNAEFGTCPTGWKSYGQYCYQFNVDSKTWSAASLACKAQSAELASVHSSVEQANIALETGPYGTDQFHWLGLHDTGVESAFEWTDGTPVQFTHWRTGQPDNWRNIEHCVHTVNYESSMWNDIHCTYNQGYICKKAKSYIPISPNPTTAPQTVRICEFTSGVLSCPSGTVIMVQTANYGRTSSSVCGFNSQTNCKRDVAAKLKTQCGGSNYCTLRATNQNAGGDPCPRVRKYLEIQYYCKKAAPNPACPGWQQTPDGNRCFKLFMEKKSWTDARDACKAQSSELVSIHTGIENVVLTSLMISSWDGADVWIGLNDYAQRGKYRWQDGTAVDFNSWQNGEPDDPGRTGSCVKAKLRPGGGDWMFWQDEECSKPLAYVCAKFRPNFTPTTLPPTTAPDGACPAGWVPNGSSCYRIESQQKTWIEARDACRALMAGANLVSIHSDAENAIVQNLTYNASAFSAWTGLSDRGVLFGHAWSDWSVLRYTNWKPGQPDSHNGRQPCVEIYSTGEWSDTGCYSTKPYVCKVRRPSKTTAPPPTTQPPTTPTQDPTICDPGWELWNTMCYLFVNGSQSTQVSWHDARAVCRKSRGELASILSEAENNFVFSRIRRHYKDSWIGLNDLSYEGKYGWSDKSPLAFTKWADKEPNDYYGQEDCVELSRWSTKWNDQHCEQNRPFVCKKHNTTVFPAFTMAPPVGPPGPAPGRCNDSWVYYNSRCYKIVTDIFLSWENALSVCKRGMNSSTYGELVSISDQYEQAFLTTQMLGKKGRFWIGLNDKHLEGSFYWADNSPQRFTNWNGGQPANSYYKDCVDMSSTVTAGGWSVVPCSSTQGYICETAALPPGPKRPLFTVGVSVYARWTDALYYKGVINKDSSDTLSVKFDIGEQLTFQRADLKAVVLDKVPPKNVIVAGTEVIAAWPNGKQFYPAVVSQIDPSKNPGYFVHYDDGSSGWTSLSGLRVFQNLTSGSCPSNYVSFGDMCYMVSYTKLTWKEAREACASRDSGQLISIHSEIQQAVMVQNMVNFAGNFWTGLYREADSKTFSWADDSRVDFTKWGNAQPSVNSSSRACVQALNTVGSVGSWGDTDCSEKKGFICQINQGDPQVTPTLQGSCPDGWTKFEKHCYLFRDGERLVWTTARQSCRKQGGDLVSVVSLRELNFIVHSLKDKPSTSLWTGLNDRSTEQHFEWSDGSPLTFTNWNPKEPNDRTGTENCVEMSSRGGGWNDLSCGRFLGYICKSQLECSTALGMASRKITDDQLTASPSSDSAHGPAAARLNGSSAWCAKSSDNKQFIQVDFRNRTRLTKIATQGYKQDGVEKFVRSFTLQFSGDGQTWTSLTENGRDKILFANTDASGVVFTRLSPPVDAQFVRVRPSLWNTNVCLRLEFYGCSFDCETPLGMGSNKIKDGSLSSSSVLDSDHPATQARPLGKAWCAKATAGQWVQVQFPALERKIVKITTWGSARGYVKVYSLAFVANVNQWTMYKEGQRVRNFRGNSDATTPTTHYLANPISTKSLRIFPQSWSSSGLCLRFELYGCVDGCSSPVGLAQGSIPDSALAASSSMDAYPPREGRLGGRLGWCGVPGDQDPSFKVDLGTLLRLTRMAIQGAGDDKGFVKTFFLQFSNGDDAEERWKPYRENGEDKLFTGNSDSKTVVTRNFQNVIRAKSVKVLPKSYEKNPCLRVEFYGCKTNVRPTAAPDQVVAYKGSVKLTKVEWKDDYSNRSSPAAVGLAKRFVVAIKELYSDLDEASMAFKTVRVTGYRRGSVVVEFRVSFFRDTATQPGVNVTSKLIAAVSSGRLGHLPVDKDSLTLAVDESGGGGGNGGSVAPQTRNRTSSGGLSGGAIAGIVITVLLLVALAVVAVVWFRMKRGGMEMFKHQSFENPVHFSSKTYDLDG